MPMNAITVQSKQAWDCPRSEQSSEDGKRREKGERGERKARATHTHARITHLLRRQTLAQNTGRLAPSPTQKAA